MQDVCALTSSLSNDFQGLSRSRPPTPDNGCEHLMLVAQRAAVVEDLVASRPEATQTKKSLPSHELLPKSDRPELQEGQRKAANHSDGRPGFKAQANPAGFQTRSGRFNCVAAHADITVWHWLGIVIVLPGFSTAPALEGPAGRGAMGSFVRSRHACCSETNLHSDENRTYTASNLNKPETAPDKPQ